MRLAHLRYSLVILIISFLLHPIKTTNCFDPQQFPFFFGDGATANFDIDFIDVNSDTSIVIFGGTGFITSPTTTVPVVGAYSTSGSGSLKWLKYYSGTTNSIQNAQAIAFGFNENYVIVGFANNFMVATLSINDGSVLHSGMSAAVTSNFEIATHGVILDSNDLPIISYIDSTTSTLYIQQFNQDYSQTQWQVTGASPRAAYNLEYRDSDQTVFLSNHYYDTSATIQNVLSIFKIDTGTGGGTEYRFSPQDTLPSNYKFKHLKLLSNSFGGCIDSVSPNNYCGYFYYDESSDQFVGQVRNAQSSTIECIAFFLKAANDFGYLYQLNGLQAIRYLPLNDPFDSVWASHDFYLYGFSVAPQFYYYSQMYLVDMKVKTCLYLLINILNSLIELIKFIKARIRKCKKSSQSKTKVRKDDLNTKNYDSSQTMINNMNSISMLADRTIVELYDDIRHFERDMTGFNHSIQQVVYPSMDKIIGRQKFITNINQEVQHIDNSFDNDNAYFPYDLSSNQRRPFDLNMFR